MSNNGRRTRARPKNTIRRQSGVVLIVGDGETEREYFLRLSSLCGSVGIKAYPAKKTGTDLIIRKTKEHVKEHELDPKNGDFVAIVMDLDDRFSKSQIEDMRKKCEKLGYNLFISNPSFEAWLLCHFRLPTHKYSSQAELEEELDKELKGRYKKSKGFDINDEMVDKAIVNAKKLLPEDECTPEGCYDRNPSTMVYRLVETIRKRVRGR